MKTLITIIFSLSTFNVFASSTAKSGPVPTPSSSWTEIRSNNRVIIKEHILYSQEGVQFSTMDACYDAESQMFRSLEPFKKKECLEWDSQDFNGLREPRCLKYSEEIEYFAKAPAESHQVKCVKFNERNKQCEQTTEINFILKQTHLIPVHDKERSFLSREDAYGDVLFEKEYSVPTCRDAYLD